MIFFDCVRILFACVRILFARVRILFARVQILFVRFMIWSTAFFSPRKEINPAHSCYGFARIFLISICENLNIIALVASMIALVAQNPRHLRANETRHLPPETWIHPKKFGSISHFTRRHKDTKFAKNFKRALRTLHLRASVWNKVTKTKCQSVGVVRYNSEYCLRNSAISSFFNISSKYKFGMLFANPAKCSSTPCAQKTGSVSENTYWRNWNWKFLNCRVPSKWLHRYTPQRCGWNQHRRLSSR